MIIKWVAEFGTQCIICEDWFHGRHLGKAEDDCDKDEANVDRLVDPDFRYVINIGMHSVSRIM